MEVKKIKEVIEKTLNKNKANNIIAIDLKKKSYIADYMIIASGTSSRHLQSLSEIGLIGTSFVYFVFLFFIYKIFTQIKRSLQFDLHTLGFLSIKSAIVLNLWPIIPSGNFFLSWYGFIYFLPISFYFFYYKNNK